VRTDGGVKAGLERNDEGVTVGFGHLAGTDTIAAAFLLVLLRSRFNGALHCFLGNIESFCDARAPRLGRVEEPL
jgi:hypothetical protein